MGSLIGWGSSPDDEIKLPPSRPPSGGPAMAGQANDKIPMSNKIQNPNVLKKEVNSDQKEKRMNCHESVKSEKHEIIIGF